MTAHVDLDASRPNVKGGDSIPVKLATAVNGIRFTASVQLDLDQEDRREQRQEKILKFLRGIGAQTAVLTSRETFHLD